MDDSDGENTGKGEGESAGSDSHYFLRDDPIQSLNKDEFSHKQYVNTLVRVVKKIDPPWQVALFGRWGTGKTSILKLIGQELEGTSPPSDPKFDSITFIEFDAWKHAEGSIRTEFLLTVDEALSDDDEGVLGEEQITEEVLDVTVRNERKTWKGPRKFREYRVIGSEYLWTGLYRGLGVVKSNWVWILSALATLGLLLAATQFPDLLPLDTSTLLTAVLIPIIFYTLKGITKTESGYKRWHNPRQEWSGAYSNLFEDILDAHGEKRDEKFKYAIAIDNLDRCEPEVAYDVLISMKTFFEDAKARCVYLVPCDKHTLRRHIGSVTDIDEESGEQGEQRETESEFLRKFFQTTINLPPIEVRDIRSYTERQFETLQEDRRPQEEDAVVEILTKYRVRTPRQIKHTINRFLSLYELAENLEDAEELEYDAVTADEPFLMKIVIIQEEFPDVYERFRDEPALVEQFHEVATDVSPAEIARGRDERGDAQFASDGGATLTASNAQRGNDDEMIRGVLADNPELHTFLRETADCSAPAAPYIYLSDAEYADLLGQYEEFRSALREGDAERANEKLDSFDTTRETDVERVVNDTIRREFNREEDATASETDDDDDVAGSIWGRIRAVGPPDISRLRELIPCRSDVRAPGSEEAVESETVETDGSARDPDTPGSSEPDGDDDALPEQGLNTVSTVFELIATSVDEPRKGLIEGVGPVFDRPEIVSRLFDEDESNDFDPEGIWDAVHARENSELSTRAIEYATAPALPDSGRRQQYLSAILDTLDSADNDGRARPLGDQFKQAVDERLSETPRREFVLALGREIRRRDDAIRYVLSERLFVSLSEILRESEELEDAASAFESLLKLEGKFAEAGDISEAERERLVDEFVVSAAQLDSDVENIESVRLLAKLHQIDMSRLSRSAGIFVHDHIRDRLEDNVDRNFDLVRPWLGLYDSVLGYDPAPEIDLSHLSTSAPTNEESDVLEVSVEDTLKTVILNANREHIKTFTGWIVEDDIDVFKRHSVFKAFLETAPETYLSSSEVGDVLDTVGQGEIAPLEEYVSERIDQSSDRIAFWAELAVAHQQKFAGVQKDLAKECINQYATNQGDDIGPLLTYPAKSYPALDEESTLQDRIIDNIRDSLTARDRGLQAAAAKAINALPRDSEVRSSLVTQAANLVQREYRLDHIPNRALEELLLDETDEQVERPVHESRFRSIMDAEDDG